MYEIEYKIIGTALHVEKKPLPQPQEQPEHLFIFYCIVGAVSIWEMKN